MKKTGMNEEFWSGKLKGYVHFKMGEVKKYKRRGVIRFLVGLGVVVASLMIGANLYLNVGINDYDVYFGFVFSVAYVAFGMLFLAMGIFDLVKAHSIRMDVEREKQKDNKKMEELVKHMDDWGNVSDL